MNVNIWKIQKILVNEDTHIASFVARAGSHFTCNALVDLLK